MAWVQCTGALDLLRCCYVSSFVQFLDTWQHLNESSASVHWTQAFLLNLPIYLVCLILKFERHGKVKKIKISKGLVKVSSFLGKKKFYGNHISLSVRGIWFTCQNSDKNKCQTRHPYQLPVSPCNENWKPFQKRSSLSS